MGPASCMYVVSRRPKCHYAAHGCMISLHLKMLKSLSIRSLQPVALMHSSVVIGGDSCQARTLPAHFLCTFPPSPGGHFQEPRFAMRTPDVRQVNDLLQVTAGDRVRVKPNPAQTPFFLFFLPALCRRLFFPQLSLLLDRAMPHSQFCSSTKHSS